MHANSMCRHTHTRTHRERVGNAALVVSMGLTESQRWDVMLVAVVMSLCGWEVVKAGEIHVQHGQAEIWASARTILQLVTKQDHT